MDRYPSNLPIAEQSYRRVEVVTGTPRRRRWSAEEKAQIVAESSAPGAVARSVALHHGVHPNQLYGWRRQFRLIGGTAILQLKRLIAHLFHFPAFAARHGLVEFLARGSSLRGVEHQFTIRL